MFQGVKKGLDVICASHTTVCLFLLKRTWNFFSQSFVKWADEQVLHLISMLVLSFNNALQLSHILCFIKLSSSMYENLHDSISSFRAKSSWTKFSFSGICFSTVQTSILISLVVRYFFYFCISRLVHLKFCMWYIFFRTCFKLLKG